MSEQSPFDRRHLEKAAKAPESGLLDHLGLPQEIIDFLRNNQRIIWTVTVCIAVVVVVLALYDSYTKYREEKASSALTLALKAEDGQKNEALMKVVDKYGTTASGLWARIELARLDNEKGDVNKAIEELLAVKEDASKDDPIRPLLLYNLAGLYENTKAPDKAITTYKELLSFKGFEAVAYKALGRIYEQQKKNDQALAMYQKYIVEADREKEAGRPDPDLAMIKDKINHLEK